MAKNSTIELIIKIGAIISLVVAILDAIPYIPIGLGWGFVGMWGDIIMGVVIVLLALAILYNLGVLKSFFFKIPTDFVPLLIVGLIILIPTGNWGGIPILVAAFWEKFG